MGIYGGSGNFKFQVGNQIFNAPTVNVTNAFENDYREFEFTTGSETLLRIEISTVPASGVAKCYLLLDDFQIVMKNFIQPNPPALEIISNTCNATIIKATCATNTQVVWQDGTIINSNIATKTLNNSGTFTAYCKQSCNSNASQINVTLLPLSPVTIIDIGGDCITKLDATNCTSDITWKLGSQIVSNEKIFTPTYLGTYTVSCKTNCNTLVSDTKAITSIKSLGNSYFTCSAIQGYFNNSSASYTVTIKIDGIEVTTLTNQTSGFSYAMPATYQDGAQHTGEVIVKDNATYEVCALGGTSTFCCGFNIGTLADITTCAGKTITLTAPNVGSGYTYSWSGPNGFSSSEQNPTLTISTLSFGTYTLSVSKIGATGCSGSTTFKIQQLSAIAAQIKLKVNGAYVTGDPYSPTTGAVVSLESLFSTSYQGSDFSYVWKKNGYN